MKKLLILLLILSFTLSIFSDKIETENTNYYINPILQGQNDANKADYSFWTYIGIGSGCLFNVAGCLGSTLIGYLVPTIESTRDLSNAHPSYIEKYTKSFTKKVKDKQAQNVFVGGSIGVVLFFLCYIAYYISIFSIIT